LFLLATLIRNLFCKLHFQTSLVDLCGFVVWWS